VNPWSDWEPVIAARVFVLGHGYLAIGVVIAVAVIVGTFLHARNERRSRR
jgi:hypothetical protein